MTGPNSGPGHNSLLVYVEGQIDYAVSGITTILRDNLRYLDVRADVQRRYNRRIQKRLTQDDLDVGLQQLVSDRRTASTRRCTRASPPSIFDRCGTSDSSDYDAPWRATPPCRAVTSTA